MNFRQLHLRPATPLRSRRVLHLFAPVSTGMVPTWSHVVPAAFVIDPDPELSPRQNLIMLLQAAAEVEHSLLVQYLYAAYSLKPSAAAMRNQIVSIAKEEMGHLLTVQNVLRFVGGPLHLDRQRFPYRSQLYPFPFKLEPLTKKSLAKYVFAEMPSTVDPILIPTDQQTEIRRLALEDADEEPVNHVGQLYETIIASLGSFHESDFPSGTAPWQALAASWSLTGNDPGPSPGVKVFGATSIASAVAALQAVAIQGEGVTPDAATDPSVQFAHFKRFYDLFTKFTDGSALPVPENPNTTNPPQQPIADAEGHILEDKLSKGRITRAETNLWAHLFNVRYHMLLAELSHSLVMPVAVKDGKPVTADTQGATPTPRDTLVGWVYEDMVNGTGSLKFVAKKLVTLDRTDSPSEGKAGAPFELPFSLALPDRGPDRWQLHHDLILASNALVDALDPQGQDSTLQQIKADSSARLDVVSANINSGF